MIHDVSGEIHAHMSAKNRNGLMCSFRLKQDDVEKFDRRIRRAGFTSRSDFFTALVRIIINETEEQNPLASAKAWACEQMPDVSEETIERAIEDAIKQHLFAVIAINGADVAYERTWKDLRSIVREKTGVWTTASELRCAYTRFEDKHRRELYDYNQTLSEEIR